MELGGKSPVLIFEDADIERALEPALFTIFSINGERCTAGSRTSTSAKHLPGIR
ncbi:aldehyde dehydrogenase family protein [Escherichia coli]